MMKTFISSEEKMNNFFKNFNQYQLKEWNKKIVSEIAEKYKDLIKKNTYSYIICLPSKQ